MLTQSPQPVFNDCLFAAVVADYLATVPSLGGESGGGNWISPPFTAVMTESGTTSADSTTAVPRQKMALESAEVAVRVVEVVRVACATSATATPTPGRDQL